MEPDVRISRIRLSDKVHLKAHGGVHADEVQHAQLWPSAVDRLRVLRFKERRWVSLFLFF